MRQRAPAALVQTLAEGVARAQAEVECRKKLLDDANDAHSEARRASWEKWTSKSSSDVAVAEHVASDRASGWGEAKQHLEAAVAELDAARTAHWGVLRRSVSLARQSDAWEFLWLPILPVAGVLALLVLGAPGLALWLLLGAGDVDEGSLVLLNGVGWVIVGLIYVVGVLIVGLISGTGRAAVSTLDRLRQQQPPGAGKKPN